MDTLVTQTRLLNLVSVTLFFVITTVFCQGTDHQMLIENCNWDRTYWVIPTTGSEVTLTSPSVTNHNLAPNLVCQTRFYVNEEPYFLKIRVRKFDLKGSDDCSPRSEMLILQFSDYSGHKNITWCGKMYAEEMKLPVKAVNVIYKTGASGEGKGFEIEFSAVQHLSCQDQQVLSVTTQPKLLYSPNYPGFYRSSLACKLNLHAGSDQYIHIQSQFIQIENSDNCRFDALIINNVKYCGEKPIDIVVNSSLVQVQFVSDSSKELSGFVLKYVAVPVEIVNCSTLEQNINVNVNTVQSVVVMVNQMSSSTKRSNSSSLCQVTLDSGSYSKVINIMFPHDLSNIGSYKMLVGGETSVGERLPLFITDSSGPHPYQEDRPSTLNFLRSPGRWIAFSADLEVDRFMFRVQAVDHESLPQSITARYSLVWVSSSLARSPIAPTILVMPEKTEGQNIEVGVYDPSVTDFANAYRLPVADYASVYNGEDTSYFELTRSCDGNVRRVKSVYSINSQNITVTIKRNTFSTGFWLYFGPSNGYYLPQPEEISMSKTFKSDSQINMKNLYCAWTLSQSIQFSRGYLIRFKAENNFNPDIVENSFIVAEEKATLMRYTQETKKDIWMNSCTPINITVSIFNAEANLQPLYFEFHYAILDNWNNTEPLYCQPKQLQANETIQFAATPNYPDFYMNTVPCEWTVERTQLYDIYIVIEFPDLSNFPCSEQHEFQILTSDSGEDFILSNNLCSGNSFKQRYSQDRVKIKFFSGSKYLLPGFNFEYYSIGPSTAVTLQATASVQYLTSPDYPAKYPNMVNYEWHITSGSGDYSVVAVELMDFSLEAASRFQCINDYVEVYDGPSTDSPRLKVMCGNVYYAQFNSTYSDMTIVFHSDRQNNYKGFMFKYYAEEKTCNIADCGRNTSSAGIIIGAVIGGIFFVLIIVGAVIFVLRRKKWLKRNAHNSVTRPAANVRQSSARVDVSLFTTSPAYINPSLAPPPYWLIANCDLIDDPPPYFNTDDSAGHTLPVSAPRWCNDYEELDIPHPYSVDFPSGTHQESYVGPNNSRVGSVSVGGAQVPTAPEVAADGDNIVITANASPELSHSYLISLGGHQVHSDSSPPLEAPPAYESESFLQNEREQQQDRGRIPPHKKSDRLGSL